MLRETLDYVLRDMTDPQGGFYTPKTPIAKGRKASSISGGSTNWSGPRRRGGRTFATVYGASEPGNFEGRNILHEPRPLAETAAPSARNPRNFNANLSKVAANFWPSATAASGRRSTTK